MGRGSSGSWVKPGCLAGLVILVVVLIVAGASVGIALRQNSSASFEQQARLHGVDEGRTPGSPTATVRLRLLIHTAGVSVKPIEAGEAIRVDADYDPRLHILRQSSERVGAVEVITVELRPAGSTLMALLRAKVGGRLPMLRIGLPRDVPLEIEGDLARGITVMELGGLRLRSASLDVEDGGIKLSFGEPLPAPMEELRVVGNRGSLSVAGLGNASPRETVLFQHIGAVDLDLRGAWSRDGSVRVIGGGAGGSLWLPDNVEVTGLDTRHGVRFEKSPEIPLPRLELSVEEHLGRFVVMD